MHLYLLTHLVPVLIPHSQHLPGNLSGGRSPDVLAPPCVFQVPSVCQSWYAPQFPPVPLKHLGWDESSVVEEFYPLRIFLGFSGQQARVPNSPIFWANSYKSQTWKKPGEDFPYQFRLSAVRFVLLGPIYTIWMGLLVPSWGQLWHRHGFIILSNEPWDVQNLRVARHRSSRSAKVQAAIGTG